MRTFKILFVVLLILMVTTSCYNSDYEYTSDTISTAKLQETLSNIKNENSNSNEELVIRFITIGKENAWRSVNHNDIINSAEKFDVDFELLDAGSTEQEIYIDMLKKSVEQDIDIIGFTPVIETGWAEILEKAKEAEIPVIILDRIVNCTDESLWMSRIVNDFYKEGQMAGEWLIDYLERQEKSDEEIKIVEIRGTDNAEAATDKSQ